MQSLHQVLSLLQSQILTPEQQQFQELCAYWPEIVGTVARLHSRAVSWHRGVLNVATSSATWSQELTLKRIQLLYRLNQKLLFPVEDIRFSTAQWRYQCHGEQHRSLGSTSDEFSQLWQDHPSRVNLPPTPTEPLIHSHPHASTTPLTAFQRWANIIQQRSQHIPLCPQCHCPTPPGELTRWSVCCLCAMKTLEGSGTET
ncbi:hypothetical protein PCC9214_01939 [Planktothrix tepida]|uniref:DUF721 domain-containing protein n=1 Tax=Planktothrix tepida PCC 9214 TaxID=671072 RepID=A0A1J1LKT5_9CYAN|nr:DciA family protein [Planktothrix tepida]CAD5941213.1 hypothetical protein PCC9214_01939 [Planktothrix tepida]CUR33103.1 conserved hypothetical protein [Planktothrix tepida PCC 9214]